MLRFQTKTVSDAFTVNHGDLVTLGSSTLELHIHEGTNTCDDCEPGLVQAKLQEQEEEKEEQGTYINISI